MNAKSAPHEGALANSRDAADQQERSTKAPDAGADYVQNALTENRQRGPENARPLASRMIAIPELVSAAEASWCKMPLAVAFADGLTATDLRVYAAVDFKCGKRGFWWGSQDTILEVIGESRATLRAIRESVKRLRDRGFILTERQGVERATVLLYAIPARATGGNPPIATDRQKTAGATRRKPTMPPAENRRCKDTDHPTEPTKEKSLSRAIADFTSTWASAIGTDDLDPAVPEGITLALTEGYRPDWIRDAINETASKGKSRWAYTAGILANWKRDGRRAAPSRRRREPLVLEADPLAAMRGSGRLFTDGGAT